MEKARRRHVPAFGEWNYYYSPSSSSSPPAPELAARPGVAAPEWWCSPEPEVRSDVWFRYSPPPRKAPPAPRTKKPRRPEHKPRVIREEPGAAAIMAARAPAKASRRVVRPVDEDLYQVPPPEDFASSRWPQLKRAPRRSLWMGCLGGLGCIA